MSVHFITEEDISIVKRVRDNVPVIVAIFTLGWIFLYSIVRRLLPQKSPEYCIRIVTLFHGLVTSYYGIHECMDGALAGTPLPQTNNQAIILAFSASYFVLDLIWCLLYQTETMLMLFHHIYSVIALIRILTQGYSGSQSVCGLATAEITNPLLQTRWFLRTAGYQDSALFIMIEVLFMMTFACARILFGTIFTIAVVFSMTNDVEFKFLTIIIYILSWLFVVNIVQYVQKKYLSTSDEGQEVDDFKNTPSS